GVRELIDPGRLSLEIAERGFAPGLERLHLGFAGTANLIETFEPTNHLVELGTRGQPGIADLIGHIACRIGNYGQLAAEFVHVFQRSGADTCNGIDPVSVVLDERGEALGAAGYPFDRQTAY